MRGKVRYPSALGLLLSTTWAACHCSAFVPLYNSYDTVFSPVTTRRKSSAQQPLCLANVPFFVNQSDSNNENDKKIYDENNSPSTSTTTTTTAVVHPKSQDDVDFIRERLHTSFVFECLQTSKEETLIGAFELSKLPKDTKICRQGEPGNYFYILQHGKVEFVVDGNVVGQASGGGAFGARALLYDAPRAATVTAQTDVSVWRVDRDTFQEYYQAPVYPKTRDELKFVQTALQFDRIFDSLALELGEKEVDTLVSAFEKFEIEDEKDICIQGEPGDYFYIIEQGFVKFFVDGNEVGMVGEAQTFGELALLYNAPRAATAKAFGGNVKLWRVDRATFRAVLGSQTLSKLEVYAKRVELKQKLEEAAILQFSHDGPEHYCEDIMAELEQLRPIARPAYHCSVNGDWCMVKAGTSTIDMALIEILSKVSQIVPFLDFEDVYITLSDNASLVTCNIFLKLFGVLPVKVNAFTSMKNDDDHPEGIRMFELFEGSRVFGIDFKPPSGLIQPRPLDITFLDGDIMIARNPNSGGEPHLLVRIRSNPDEDPDHKYTGFFEKARLLYGDRITRCLVDRQLGNDKASSSSSLAGADLESLLDADRPTTKQ